MCYLARTSAAHFSIILLDWSRKINLLLNKVIRRSFWSNYIFMKVISNERFLKSSFDILTKREKGSFHSYTYSFALSMIYLTFHIYRRKIFFIDSSIIFKREREKKLLCIHSFIIMFILYLINIERIHTSSTVLM